MRIVINIPRTLLYGRAIASVCLMVTVLSNMLAREHFPFDPSPLLCAVTIFLLGITGMMRKLVDIFERDAVERIRGKD